MFENGYIKLHRSLLTWEWWHDLNTTKFFLYCLLRCNWEPAKWRGTEVPAGSFISSYENMAAESGLSVQNVRTAIKHLTKTGEIICKSSRISTSGETVINVVNWGIYQGDIVQPNKRLTSDQHTTNKRLTYDQQATNNNIRKKEYKEYKEEKEICSVEPDDYSDEYFESWIIDNDGEKKPIFMKTIETEDSILYLDRAGKLYKSDFDKGYILTNE